MSESSRMRMENRYGGDTVTVKAVRKVCNLLFRIVKYSLLLILGYVLLLVVAFDTFNSPTNSMTPTIHPGYRGVINKLKLGGRLFDIFKASGGEKVNIYRLPGYGHLERNDIVVFNGTFKDDWNRLEMNMALYYCKRVMALSGDTLEIKDGVYEVRGYTGMLGVMREQIMLGNHIKQFKQNHGNDSIPEWAYSLPFSKSFGWTISDMGPLVVPKRGSTIELNSINYLIYRKYIEWETGNQLSWTDSGAVLGGNAAISGYTFTENYFFAGGDNAIDSQDSRYWGFVPEDFIVGVVPISTP